jgi:AcrR family transcriptional regulator
MARAAPAPTPAKAAVAREGTDVRRRILETASALFYQRGVRAVGVDLVLQESGAAKASLYRHFPTKDDLIVAYLEREEVDFWRVWDEVAARHPKSAAAELEAHLQWIGERLARGNYRGCPQINVAAEFAESSHPAREVARAHMNALRTRLASLAKRLGVARPEVLGAQLALLVNGAFASSELLGPEEATRVLQAAGRALVAAAR